MAPDVFRLNPHEPFPRLTRPPIVEAVIHWQARAVQPFSDQTLSASLAPHFPDRSPPESIHQVELTAHFSQAPEDASSQVSHKRRWQGVRVRLLGGREVAQFTRDGLVFSRVRDYENWEPFLEDARRAWLVYREIAQPLEIERLGVRFINHISEATAQSIQDYLREPPTCPSGLPLKEFVYQSTFDVPGHPFQARVIKVIQPSMPGLATSSGLFLDIDVFTTGALPVEGAEVDDALSRLRCLKNKVFFDLITEAAVSAFSRSDP